MFKRFYFHIIFWIIIAGINLGFGIRFFTLQTALLSTLTVLLFQMSVFYSNAGLIFPRFFSLSDTGRFILISASFVLAVTLLQTFVETRYLSRLIFRNVPPFDSRIMMMIFMRSFFWLLFIDMISTVFMMQDRIREQAGQTQKIIAEKLKTELKLLKAQINPHFIFNALNNIYSLSYLKSDKAPESVLKLSEMLRYVIEECENEKVPLKSEINYIQNYITFQKMKSQEEQNISFDYTNTDQEAFIAPMLFIPLIENSFKYSMIEDLTQAFIRIELKQEKDDLHFHICNSVPLEGKMHSGAGTGLKNVRQRLEIIYPEKHTLAIHEKTDEYSVHLTLLIQ